MSDDGRERQQCERKLVNYGFHRVWSVLVGCFLFYNWHLCIWFYGFVDDCAGIIAPIAGSEIDIRLERPARHRGRPRYDGLAVGIGDGEQRRAGCLHGVEHPKTTRERVVAASHRPAGVVLADGAADRINAAHARAASVGDLMPVYRVALRVAEGGKQQPQKQYQPSHGCLISARPFVSPTPATHSSGFPANPPWQLLPSRIQSLGSVPRPSGAA